MTISGDLATIRQDYYDDDQTFRTANGTIGTWDSLQPLTQAKKDEHQTRINAALVTRAGQDSQNHAAFDAKILEVAAMEADMSNLDPRVTALEATVLGLDTRLTAEEVVNKAQSATILDHSIALAQHAASLSEHEADLFDLVGELATISARVTAIENEAPGPNVTGWIDVDTFSTGTDTQKLAAARLEAIATGKGLQLTPREWDVTAPLPLWEGWAIDVKADPGPNMLMLPPVLARIDASAISGAWLTVGSDLRGGYLGNLSFFGGTTARLIRTSGGILYGCQFDSVSIYGGAGGWGNDIEALTCTQCYWTGHTQIHGFRQTPLRVIGADNQFGWYCNVDSPTDVPGNGRPNVWLEIEKSWGVGPYSTGRTGWVAARFGGNPDRQLTSLFGGVYEGYKPDQPTAVAAVEVQGGGYFLDGASYGHVVTAPGMIVQSGGHLILGPSGVKFADAALTLPWVWQTTTAATVDIQSVPVGGGRDAQGVWSRRPVPVRLGNGQVTNLQLANRLPV